MFSIFLDAAWDFIIKATVLAVRRCQAGALGLKPASPQKDVLRPGEGTAVPGGTGPCGRPGGMERLWAHSQGGLQGFY